jgi:hypothetical protein
MPCAVADFAGGEQRLQAVVGGARQQHAAQHLEALVAGERRLDGGAAQEAVAVVEQRSHRLSRSASPPMSAASCRQCPAAGRAAPASPELAAQRRPERVDVRLTARLGAAGHRITRVERLRERERMPLGDERAEPAGETVTFCNSAGLAINALV